MYVRSLRDKYPRQSANHNYDTRVKDDLVVPYQRINRAIIFVNYYALKICDHYPHILKHYIRSSLK